MYVGRHVGGKHVLWLEGGMWICVFVKGVGGNGWLCVCVCVLLAYIQNCESAMIRVGKASWVWQKLSSL